MIVLIFSIWFILGVHSAYYFIRQHTKYFDLETSMVPYVIICFLLPVIMHLVTLVMDSDGVIIIKKKK